MFLRRPLGLFRFGGGELLYLHHNDTVRDQLKFTILFYQGFCMEGQ
jgi:hypothetical protein